MHEPTKELFRKIMLVSRLPTFLVFLFEVGTLRNDYLNSFDTSNMSVKRPFEDKITHFCAFKLLYFQRRVF